MRIDKISIRGLTTYREETSLDLAGLGPGIIAVAGPNGSGKTTLLEAIPGAIFRQTPSRGSIATMATVRDARIEIVGENGTPFTVYLDIDAQTGKQEAIILDAAGKALAGPKVRDFDAYVADHFPTLDVYLASFFASQTGVGSVLKMSRSDRRALFGRLLGLERLEQMATTARESARATETDMAAARAALEAVKSGAEDVATLEESLRFAKEDETKAGEASRNAAENLRIVSEKRDKLMAVIAEAQRAEKAASEARQRASAAKDALAKIEAQIRDLEPLLAKAGEIRENAAKIKELTAEMEQARTDGEAISIKREALQIEVNKRARAAEAAARIYRDATWKLDMATDGTDKASERLINAEKSTASVPCARVLDDAIRSACPALVGHFRTRDEAKQIIDGYNKSVPALFTARDSAAEVQKNSDADEAAVNKELNGISCEVDVLRTKYKEIRERVEKRKAVDRSVQLDRAEAAAAGLQGALESARQSVAAASAEAEKLQAAVVVVDLAELKSAEEDVLLAGQDRENSLQAAMGASNQVARLDVRLRSALEAQAKTEALTARLAPMEADLADWRWLARGLGREGVQALELDAAGPRVSGLANELLADAYGPRFQIRFETQAAKADGKGVKETFDVVVVDTEKGREGNGEDLSGGEKVIVGEALGLAVGLFHAQAAGVTLGTVIRDETVGALDPENGERYIAMLKSFLRVGRVHQLLYVAHQPALVDMADAVVRVDNGRIEVS